MVTKTEWYLIGGYGPSLVTQRYSPGEIIARTICIKKAGFFDGSGRKHARQSTLGRIRQLSFDTRKVRKTIPKHKDVSIAPSDGDVPRNDRPPSKTAFFDRDVPFFCRPPSLPPRKPLPLRERDIPAYISRSGHKNGLNTSNFLREREISAEISRSGHKNCPKTSSLLCEREICAIICRSRHIVQR